MSSECKHRLCLRIVGTLFNEVRHSGNWAPEFCVPILFKVLALLASKEFVLSKLVLFNLVSVSETQKLLANCIFFKSSR